MADMTSKAAGEIQVRKYFSRSIHVTCCTQKSANARRAVGGLCRAEAEMIRRFIAEHAHRFIFAASPDAEVPKLRPRIVDLALLRDEDEQWRRWQGDQTNAERELIDSRKQSD